MDNLEYTWYTGDWKPNNNPTVPYNGLKIVATPNYGPLTSPPTPGKLVSVALEVVDYTYDPNGVSSLVTLSNTSSWYSIEIPEDTSVSPPAPNLKFTVQGAGSTILGQVKLDAVSSGIYLNIQFCYGPTSRQREEIGYIMKFSETTQAGTDPVTVEE